ncbi:SRPBCC family protein [Sphaerisporangium dianthi]|uniref:SRPBCC family protein n=1 Tax=Sphaerisporangium dianthi TaxID=1436120 RepID=A0ABV9CR38_9ACTN
MWSFEHSIDAAVTPAAVWSRYIDVDTWPAWNAGMEKVQLNGPFHAGGTGEVTMTGDARAPFTLTEVAVDEGFTIEVRVGPGVVTRSRCRIAALPEHGCRITHSVELDGPGGDEMGAAAGPILSGNITRGVDEVAKAAAAAV